jgi:hypothetical protein
MIARHNAGCVGSAAQPDVPVNGLMMLSHRTMNLFQVEVAYGCTVQPAADCAGSPVRYVLPRSSGEGSKLHSICSLYVCGGLAQLNSEALYS